MKDEEFIHKRRSEGGKKSALKNYPKMIVSEGYKQWRMLQPLFSRMNWERPEYREAVIKAMKERHYTHAWTNEEKESARQHALRGWSDPEHRKAHAEAMQEYWNNPERIDEQNKRKAIQKAIKETKRLQREQRQQERITKEQSYIMQDKKHGIPQRVVCATTGIEYQTAAMAERSLGLSTGSVSRCCRGYYKSVKGLVFAYVLP